MDQLIRADLATIFRRHLILLITLDTLIEICIKYVILEVDSYD